MPAPAIFEKFKCDDAALKAIFTKPEAEQSDKVKELTRLIRDRIQSGRDKNLRDHRIWFAIDMAYEAPYAQTTPTLVQHVIGGLDGKATYEQALTAGKEWGLDLANFFCDVKGADGKARKVPFVPSFFKILIPAVKSYVTIRQAKLFTDRNQIPLFKYEALKSTEQNRVRCEIITDLVSAMTQNYGYASVLRNAIFKTLLYGVTLQFPEEIWHIEEQEDESGKKFTVKEGLRYHQPHPSRFFYDLTHGLDTFNSDSGCEYSGYWSVRKYGSIMDNPLYYNTDKISYGRNWFDSSISGRYFQTIYPCQMTLPVAGPMREADREQRAAFYNKDNYDDAVFLTRVWMKLVPKRWGLGNYEHPVWFAFDVASDDTIVWAGPCAYSPTLYCGYDADEMRDRNSSLALEIIPFQDHLGNILSQIILTAKQNLANLHFFDKNIIDQTDIERFQNANEMMFRGLNFAPVDSIKQQRAGLNTANAITPVTLAKMSTAELTATMWATLNMMERMLQFSAQEVGSAASHQQSAQEIKAISANTSTRAAYTGTFIDDFIDAWKRQLYDANQAYADEEFASQVSTDIPDLDAKLRDMGFSLDDTSTTDKKRGVKGTKQELQLEGFASTRDGPDRGDDAQAGTVLMQTIQAVAGNQALSQSVGPKALLELLTQAARMAGAPRDFELRADNEGQVAAEIKAMQEQLAQMAEQIQQGAVKQATEVVGEQVSKPVAEALAQTQQAVQQNAQQTAEAIGQTQQVVDKNAQDAAAAIGQQQQALQQMQQMLQQLAVRTEQLAQIAASAPQLPPVAPQYPA